MAYLSSNHPYYLNQMLQPPSQQGGGGGGADFLQQQQQAAKGGDAMMDDDASGAMEEDSKHEQLLPIDYMPCPNTVIVGRGKKVAQHAGNVRFREYVKQELEEYSAATTKAHKSSIIIRVLTQVREKSPYAFVKQNLSTGRWYRVEETSQRITTAQAFRDALKDNYKSSRAFKKLKREEEKKMNNGEEGEGGEKKEKKRKKRASKTTAAPSPTEEAETTASPSASPPAVTPPASVVASAAAALGGGAAAAAAEEMAKKAKVDEKAMADLRSALDDAQNALLSGNIRLWNADTNIAQLKQAPGSAAAAAAAAKAPLAASLAPGSAAAAANRAALDRNFNWSFNSNLNLSGHSMLSLSRHSNKSLGLGLDHSFSNPHGAAGNTSTGSGLSAAAAELMFSNHSNLSLSRHSNFSNLGSLHRPGAAAAAAAAANPWNLSGHSTMSNLSGHSTGTFTGLVRQFGGQVDPTANPFDPRPMPGSVAAAAAYAKERAELAAAHPWLALSGATAESAPAAALAAAAREDAMDVEMDDAPAPAATASSLAAAAAARKQAAGSAAAVLNRHITQDEATALEAIGNLSDHSFMSNMSSLHSAKYSPDEIFDHKMGEAAARRNRHHHHHHHPRDPHGHLHQNPYQGHHLP